MAIATDASQLWVINEDDSNEYFLPPTFTIDSKTVGKQIEEPHVWRGTIASPAVRIVSERN